MCDFRNEKKDEILCLVKWMTDNPAKWNMICTENDIEAEGCLEVIEELEQRGFYLLIPVLLSHNMNIDVEACIDRLIARQFISNWKNKDLREISAEIREALRSA